MTNREGLKQAYEMAQKHPDAEVICMADEDIFGGGDDYSTSTAGIYGTRHDYYLMSDEHNLDETRIYFKSIEEEMVEEIVEEWCERCRVFKVPILENLKWKECIVVQVGTS